MAALPVNLIGQGRIGAAVADWLRTHPDYHLQMVIARNATDWPPAALTIDAAGPTALRTHGARLLAEGDLWTVGAAALIDAGLLDSLAAVAAGSGHGMRLFTGWIAGPTLTPRGIGRLMITQSAPGLGPGPGTVFDGPLRDAGRAFPDHLNTATAAALAGPGIDATRIRLVSTEPGGAHRIHARFEAPGNRIETEVRFRPTDDSPHPVAAAIIAALEQRGSWFRYG